MVVNVIPAAHEGVAKNPAILGVTDAKIARRAARFNLVDVVFNIHFEPIAAKEDVKTRHAGLISAVEDVVPFVVQLNSLRRIENRSHEGVDLVRGSCDTRGSGVGNSFGLRNFVLRIIIPVIAPAESGNLLCPPRIFVKDVKVHNFA